MEGLQEKRINYLAMLACTVVLKQHMHWLYMLYAEILLSVREKDESGIIANPGHRSKQKMMF
jgi:hypothetical protein